MQRASVIRLIQDRVPKGLLAVAFSGGVDSTLLLALAVEALGEERVLAVTARSDSLARSELAACEELAAKIGVRLELLSTHELEREGYRKNGSDRCYHCKTELFVKIDAIREREKIALVAYGANADDASDHRPGMQAASEHSVFAPLLEAGLTKADVRQISAELGLPTWDKPAQPCLASRIPYGQTVTEAKLARIDRAEAAVRRHGFLELRVRDCAGEAQRPVARLELPLADLPSLLAGNTREAIVADLRALGYTSVVLDLEGFRSGRLNDALAVTGRTLPVATSTV
jgi:pyridinium-3,5-biscarboxylic acid mononucleotide sulfurtransferase